MIVGRQDVPPPREQSHCHGADVGVTAGDVDRSGEIDATGPATWSAGDRSLPQFGDVLERETVVDRGRRVRPGRCPEQRHPTEVEPALGQTSGDAHVEPETERAAAPEADGDRRTRRRDGHGTMLRRHLVAAAGVSAR